MGTKSRKRMWWIVLVIVAVIGIGVIVGIAWDAPNRKEAMQLTFEDVQFSNLKDGTYIGEWKGSTSHLRDTKVEIQVAGGSVTSLHILKGAVSQEGQLVKLGKGGNAKELLQSAVEAKTLHVDVVSGATITSKTHLKALEDALKKAAQ